MEEKHQKLIDEAIANEPIKNTFRLGWEFIVLNQMFTAISLALAVVSNMFSTIVPSLGFITMIIYGIYIVGVQILIGKTIYESENIEHFVQKVKEIKIKPFVEKYLPLAIGAVIGWAVVYTVIFMVILITGFLAYIVLGSMEVAFTLVFIPASILLLFLAYVQPLIQAKMALGENLEETMMAVFTIKDKKVREQSFNKRYFRYVSSILLVFLAIPFALSTAQGMGLLPATFNTLFMIILPILMYISTVILSVGYMLSKQMVEV